jgi:hypothetical protein
MFMNIAEEINPCSWGCKFMGKDDPQTLFPHKQ